jgi:hypothetical protein
MIVAAVRQSRAEPVVRHHFPHSGDVQGSCGPWCALIEPSRDRVDASFATGQRLNAFHLSEAMRSATA